MVLSMAAGASGETADDCGKELRGLAEQFRSDPGRVPEELEKGPRRSGITESVSEPYASSDLIGKLRAFRSSWATENSAGRSRFEA